MLIILHDGDKFYLSWNQPSSFLQSKDFLRLSLEFHFLEETWQSLFIFYLFRSLEFSLVRIFMSNSLIVTVWAYFYVVWLLVLFLYSSISTPYGLCTFCMRLFKCSYFFIHLFGHCISIFKYSHLGYLSQGAKVEFLRVEFAVYEDVFKGGGGVVLLKWANLVVKRNELFSSHYLESAFLVYQLLN